MSEHETPAGEVARTDGSAVVPLEDGHDVGGANLPDRFENPGMEPHQLRLADMSEAGAKRAEKQVAALFSLSIIGTIGFIVAYFALGAHEYIFIPGIGDMDYSNAALGVALAFSLLGIGLGAVHWAKTLMPDEEIVEMRHPMRSSDEARADAVNTVLEGAEGSKLNRRPLIKYTLGGAMGLFALPLLLQLVGSLGPLPKNQLSLTYWNGQPGPNGKPVFKPLRLMRDPENTAIKATDVTVGSVFAVQPQGLLDMTSGVLEAKAKASVLLMRLPPDIIKSAKERAWGHDGIVAYSKICTHVGCPVGLYEQTTHHLLCPCHQSTFDVTEDCRVIFGPAKRPLPQLKIAVDDEGYLYATQPFQEAVGPSFPERGSA